MLVISVLYGALVQNNGTRSSHLNIEKNVNWCPLKVPDMLSLTHFHVTTHFRPLKHYLTHFFCEV